MKLYSYKQFLNENKKKIQLTIEEQDIINDILSDVSESSGTIWNKVTNYAKKGLLTSAIVLSLLATPFFSNQANANELIKLYNTTTEIPNEKIGTVEEMTAKELNYSGIFSNITFQVMSQNYGNVEGTNLAGFYYCSNGSYYTSDVNGIEDAFNSHYRNDENNLVEYLILEGVDLESGKDKVIDELMKGDAPEGYWKGTILVVGYSNTQGSKIIGVLLLQPN